ncbi:hypothetical protein GIB67_004119 [Kingdonia uniflora]|uniref:AAA+ ATPase domain-containing protein n=1 Tax=Kingdonia uniflora TaxID=39325 RepID=A0A7J7NR79_9MAGN|nr:hypothetical protein GIB67_004119 [Kingdonia uniflora]
MEAAASLIIDPVKEFVKSAFYYKEYLNNLQSKVQDSLLKLQKDVKGEVNLARDNGNVIHDAVQHWIVKVDEVRDEVAELTRQAGQINSSLRGWRSARYRLGTKSQKMIVIVEELLGEGRSFGSVSNRALVPPRVAEHFDTFASREATKKEVIQALTDDKTNLIGVFGFGGVGKTTLTKEVVEKLKLFDKVVLVTVSQNPDLKGIQREIAENLDMKIEEDAMQIRARRLSKRLKQEKSILLILDDVRTTLELAEVGIIPCGDDQNTCKVLITSRNLDVCHSMETTKNIEVQGLSERDSLELFLRKVGGVDCNALRKMSEDIVNECEGLPFAILAFARALRDKDEAAWPDMVKQIRKSLFRGISLFDGLQRKVQNDLVRLETDVKAKVDLARNNGDVIHQVVEQWLENVDKVRNEMKELHNEAREINHPFKGRHSACYRLGEESEKKVVVIGELLVEGRRFSSASNPAPVPPRVGEHFDAFASREATKNEVIQALMDDKTNLIGIYGMGGVGKTTLMKEIRKQVEETKLFDKVVFATVSQNLDLRGIQTQIAESLGMRIEGESIEAKAARLLARLKQEKNILLILDDFWTRLELSDVGIDLDEVSCKVIITSRRLDVCNSMKTTKNMKSTKNIEVKVLSNKDSLELFRQEVGDVDSDVLRKRSEEIANECGGLPLAIVTLARTLRNKDKRFWDAVIQQLKKSMCGGMSSVNASIKLSYDFLETSETKLCFLLCALFPEDHKITMDALVGYAMGEDLLGEVETLSEARGNLHIMVDTLVCSGLLLKREDDKFLGGEYKEFFMMHDIVRDAAISIARENRNESIMSAGLGLQKWPKLKEPGKCLRLSLMSNDICKVPADTLECSQLVTLSLAKNRSLADIPDGFFEGMKRLATLDWSNIGIEYLPQSLSSLNNCLRSLYLDHCIHLKDISLIGNLKTLEILSLKGGTGISSWRLPEEISGLTNLKMLNLSNYRWNLTKCDIPPNVISRLSSLEELYMLGSFRGWEMEGTGNNASLAEVASLTNLTSLYLEIANTKLLSTDFGPCHHWEKLQKFGIRVGDAVRDITPKSERYVSLSTISADSFPVAAWVNVLMETTYDLDLDLEKCEGLKNVLQLNPKGRRFYNLKSLEISNSGEMEYVVNVEEQVPETMFPNLEVLKLKFMKELKAIWNGPFLERSFEKLKVLEIYECFLPSLSWTRLQNLEEIEIGGCRKLEKVFEDGPASIFKLRSIKLWCLPGLTSIWEGAVPLIRLENLKILSVDNCPSLKSRHLFPSVAFAQRFQQLEVLTVWRCKSFIKLIAEEAEGMEIKSSPIFCNLKELQIRDCQPPIFSNLKKLEILRCNGLNYLFQIRILQGLLQLEEFTVTDCNEMEELFECEECQEEEDGIITIRLPHLRILFLWNLARLSSFFCHQKRLPHVLLECPSLEKLDINDCPNLKRLPFGTQSTPKLEKFLIKDNQWFERLEWDDQSVKSQLQQRLCDQMEELFEFEECQEEEDGSMAIRFPRLRFLSLWKLPALTSFFSHRRKLPYILDCPSLKELEISECPNLKRLPFGPRSTPKLEKFQIDNDEWFERLEVHDPSVMAQLQQLLPVRVLRF